ncbi:hypothetical protein LT493_44445 [Streptomyces tricolor]|nr:hypothetical protein [Streptomyces tricolor]
MGPPVQSGVPATVSSRVRATASATEARSAGSAAVARGVVRGLQQGVREPQRLEPGRPVASWYAQASSARGAVRLERYGWPGLQ